MAILSRELESELWINLTAYFKIFLEYPGFSSSTSPRLESPTFPAFFFNAPNRSLSFVSPLFESTKIYAINPNLSENQNLKFSRHFPFYPN